MRQAKRQFDLRSLFQFDSGYLLHQTRRVRILSVYIRYVITLFLQSLKFSSSGDFKTSNLIKGKTRLH